MSHDPSKSVAVLKRKKFYTTTGKVDEGRVAVGDVVFETVPIPQGGRDPKYFGDRCETLSIRTLVENGAAEYILARPNHPAFIRLLEFVTERSRGKVPDIIKNEHVINPAVALPAKAPEHIPDAQFEVMSGTTDPLDAPSGATERLSSGQ